MTRISQKKGMTFIETLVAVTIFTLLMIAVTYFSGRVIFYNRYGDESLTGSQNAQVILKTIIRDLRSTSPGNNGAYPIAQAATNTLMFYSDTDGDGLKEQIRYFLVGNILRKGSIKPTGVPLQYLSANEEMSQLATNVENATSSLFEYFNEDYDGTASSSPLELPIPVTGVRLIRINLIIDVNTRNLPLPVLYTSQVTLRNLKSNL